jgi:hypothetical protein
MIKSKDIAKILFNILKSNQLNKDVLAQNFVTFLEKNNLTNLLLKSKEILENKIEEDKKFNLLLIKCLNKNQINKDVLRHIKEVLNVEEDILVYFEENFEQDTGFLATYRGKMFDCRVSKNASLLLKELKKI